MKRFLFALALLTAMTFGLGARNIVRIGIIGLDTSHSPAFAKYLNNKDSKDPNVQKYEVVAAYPYGTKNIKSATSRIPKYIEEVKKYGLTITNSISELLGMVDCVFLETNDGNLHLEQAAEVFKAGKKIYIDKPLGATLGQAIAIYDLAERYGAKFFSSSAVRFTVQNVKIRNGEYGKILGADTYSPHHPEKTHPDFGYYGLHGIEALYSIMGTGCESVNRMHTEQGDIVVGQWKGGRIGSFRGITQGPYIYGGTVITEKGAIPAGGYTGYEVLLDQILKFFETGVSPISKEETLELFTFMKASNMSMARGGRIVTMAEAWKAGQKDARKLLKAYR